MHYRKIKKYLVSCKNSNKKDCTTKIDKNNLNVFNVTNVCGDSVITTVAATYYITFVVSQKIIIIINEQYKQIHKAAQHRRARNIERNNRDQNYLYQREHIFAPATCIY